MDNSSLREVFGSSASLSELSGDTQPRTPLGYSRFGLNEHRPAHQMHTRVRRYSNDPTNSDARDFVGSFPNSGNQSSSHRFPRSLWLRLPILSFFGLLHGLLLQLHLPAPLRLAAKRERLVFLGVCTILAVISGIVMPKTDPLEYESPNSPVSRPGSRSGRLGTPGSSDSSRTSSAGSNRSHSRPASRPGSSSGKKSSKLFSFQQQSWLSSLIRLYGALLGLMYFATKLPRDAVLAWLLVAPALWYISDTTVDGLLAAVAVSAVGAGTTLLQYAGQSPWHTLPSYELAFVACGSAAAFFGTALVFAEIGRGLI